MITIIRKRHHISTEPAPASLAAAQASLLDLLFKVPAEGLQNDSYLDHVLHGPKTKGVDMRGHPGFPWMLGSRIGILSSHKSHFLFKMLIQPPQSQEQLDPDERSMSFFRRQTPLSPSVTKRYQRFTAACSGTFTQKRRSPTFSVAWILGDKVLPTSITT